MIWVLTGATGLIGRALVPLLLDRGDGVIALARHAVEFFKDVESPTFHKYNFDITKDDPGFIKRHKGRMGLIMLASHISVSEEMKDLSEILKLDTFGHLSLVDHLKDRLTFGAYASSCTVYGQTDSLPADESAPLHPQNVYSLTKLASERSLLELFETLSIHLIIPRIAQVYGPGSILGGAFYNFLYAAVRGDVPKISCDPDTYRDYCHVDDIARGIIAAIEQDVAGIYNLGNGSATKIYELAQLCLNVVGRDDHPVVEKTDFVGNMLLDISKARNDFNYCPTIDIKKGICLELKRLFGGNLSDC